jgi:hypothetical protein
MSDKTILLIAAFVVVAHFVAGIVFLWIKMRKK